MFVIVISGCTSQNTCSYDSDCLGNQFCEFDSCSATTGTCIDVPANCIDIEYDPVCGCNDNTYGNDCERKTGKTSKDHDGECSGDTCYDSDFGYGYPAKLGIKGYCNDSTGIYYDYCSDSEMITDYYCSEGLCTDVTSLGCSYYGFNGGCQDGACL